MKARYGLVVLGVLFIVSAAILLIEESFLGERTVPVSIILTMLGIVVLVAGKKFTHRVVTKPF